MMPQALSTASEENGQAFEGPQEQRVLFSDKHVFWGSHIFFTSSSCHMFGWREKKRHPEKLNFFCFFFKPKLFLKHFQSCEVDLLLHGVLDINEVLKTRSETFGEIVVTFFLGGKSWVG